MRNEGRESTLYTCCLHAMIIGTHTLQYVASAAKY